MELKITLDLSERAASILEAIASAIAEKRAERVAEHVVEVEKAEKPKKAKKAKVEPEQPVEDAQAAEPKKAPSEDVKAEPEIIEQPKPVEAEKAENAEPAEAEKAEQAAPENDDELGKGESGPVIAELTAKMIARLNEECRDRATMNRNLRAECEKLGLQFPTVPALIQAVGYGNAYRICIGE